MKAIAEKLSAKNCPVQDLKVWASPGQTSWFEALKTNSSVKKIELVTAGKFDSAVMEYLSGSTFIKKLSLKDSTQGAPDAFPLLVNFLESSKSVRHLKIANYNCSLSKFSFPNVEKFIKSASGHSSLKSLTLDDTIFSVEQINALAKSVLPNAMLKELHLLQYSFNKETTSALCRLLEGNTAFRVLTVSSIPYPDPTLQAQLLGAIVKNKSLEQLNLSMLRLT